MVLAFFDGTQWLHFEVRQWTAWIAPILRQFLDVGAAVEGQFDLMGTPRRERPRNGLGQNAQSIWNKKPDFM